MRHSHPLIPALALSLLSALALLCVSTLSAQSPDEDELAALARETVEAHNDVLVSGNVGKALRRRASAERFREALEAHAPVISNRRKAMAQTGMRYTAHRTALTIDSTEIDGASATLRATEHVVLRLQTSTGGPLETEYNQAHVFEYVYERDGWRIVSDKILLTPPLLEEISAPVTTPPMRDAPPGFIPDFSRRRRPENSQASSARASRGGIAHAVLARPSLDIRLAATGIYDNSVAVNYALKYVSTYNSAYRAYSNDCTNFTSQALRAAGWPYDKTGGRTEPTTWYYGSYTGTTSYSWAAAHNFNLFFKQSGRGYAARYFSELIKGDLLQADWGPTPDGNISHSMIVTGVVNGAALMTYHSPSTKNRPLADIRAASPKTNWYGLLLYYQFSY